MYIVNLLVLRPELFRSFVATLSLTRRRRRPRSGAGQSGCGDRGGQWRLGDTGDGGQVLQKVPSEDDPEVRNHGEGPY